MSVYFSLLVRGSLRGIVCRRVNYSYHVAIPSRPPLTKGRNYTQCLNDVNIVRHNIELDPIGSKELLARPNGALSQSLATKRT